MGTVNVQFVPRSKNAKVGPIPITNSDRNTCPDSCKLKNNGCYASAGFHTRLNWDKVTAGERGGPWTELCDKVAALPAGQVWRHNVSGDLPHINQSIDMGRLQGLIDANRGKRGFTYTHHDVINDFHNRGAIRQANRDGLTINLSSDNVAEADVLKALDVGPVVTIVAEDQLDNFTTKAGNKVVICPAVTRENVSCATCKMCAIPDRNTIIAFPVHGTQKKRVNV